MYIKRIADCARIVTRFTVEQSFPNERVDLRFAQLDRQAAQAPTPAIPVQTHACGCWA
jgi:hypothetical protein